jgi:hypothetical protein
VKLETQASFPDEVGSTGSIHVTVKNPSSSIAFMVHLRVTKGPNGDDLVPIFWDDNYFSLLPGKEKTVTVSFARADLRGAEPALTIDGYNIAQTAVPITQ